MSEQQRVERWVNVYSDKADDWLEGSYSTQTAADRCAAADRVKAIRLVEIREGESIVADGPNECAFVLLDCVRKERDAAIERADAAELTVKARDIEIVTLRAILDQFEDGGMSGREVREAKADERARFERECAMRLLAAEYGAPDDEISFENAIEVESYWQRRAMWAKRTASVLADACFGAKEAKG